jgi:hypothetical protein
VFSDEYTEIVEFPALFLGPDSEAVLLIVCSPRHDDEVYYSPRDWELSPLRLLDSSLQGHNSEILRLTFQGREGPESRIVLRRAAKAATLTIDDVPFEYVHHPDLSEFAFIDMPTRYRRLIEKHGH